MATTELGTVHRIQRWDSEFLTEYVRGSRFRKFMGRAVAKDNEESGSESVIQVRSDMIANAGKTLNIPLITRLDGAGVQGYTRMTGNEEQLGIYNDQVTVHYNRNAVEIAEPDEKWTEMDLRGAAKGRLRVWAAECLRNDIIISLSDNQNRSWVSGRNADTASGTRYNPTTFNAALVADTTNNNAWQVANSDRILYANKPQIAGNNATSLAQLVVNTDKASSVVLMLAKGLAKTAGNTSGGIHIRPSSWSDEEGTENYVWFVPTTDFNNLANDADIKAANTYVRVRGMDNPIFQDGDLLYRGVIIREVPEIPA
jgi:hypothetical protein